MPKILHGDCLEVLKGMETGSVDLVFCSPPYEDARLYGELQYKVKGQDWVDWCIPRFEECLRVSKGLVAWVIEGKTRNFQWTATPALLMADLHRRGVKLRKPPIYHRVGIPGSGGPEWLRNDYEFIVCASHGRLPWADNTAMGEPPKYGVGGNPTHQTAKGRIDGERAYKAPEKANPGNVIKCSSSLILYEVFCYGYATGNSPTKVLQDLQQALDTQTVFEWCLGIRARLHASAVLRPQLFREALAYAGDTALSCLSAGVSASELLVSPLLTSLLGHSDPHYQYSRSGCDTYESQKSTKGQDQGLLRAMPNHIGSGDSPYRRESVEQRSRESTDPLSHLSRPASQSATTSDADLRSMWEAGSEEVQKLGLLVRQALPSLQKTWIAVPYQTETRQCMDADSRSNVVHCKVGGGHMGSPLAASNEAPFPESLAEFFIRSFCPPGGIVLDPFSGSGTTVAVALKTGREGIGVDIRQSQIDLTTRRIQEGQENA